MIDLPIHIICSKRESGVRPILSFLMLKLQIYECGTKYPKMGFALNICPKKSRSENSISALRKTLYLLL